MLGVSSWAALRAFECSGRVTLKKNLHGRNSLHILPLGFFVPLRFTARDSKRISRVATEESGKRQGELKTEFIVVADTHVRVSPERHGVESARATL